MVFRVGEIADRGDAVPDRRLAEVAESEHELRRVIVLGQVVVGPLSSYGGVIATTDELIAALGGQGQHDGDWSATATSVADVLRAQLPAPAFLTAAGRQSCPAGTVRCEVPPGDIHRLGNRHDDPAVTLHVYGTDVSRIGSSARRFYD